MLMIQATVPNTHVEVKNTENIEALKGNLASDFSDKKLMRSVLEGDKDSIEDGKLISNSIDLGVGAFTPDLMYDKLVSNYSMTQKMYGEAFVRQILGFEPGYLKKNIHIPEFQKDLKKAIKERIKKLKDKGLVDDQGFVLDKGLELASIVLYVEELDHLMPKGILGTKINKKKHLYGDRADVVKFKNHRFKDVAIRKSIKKAIRRGHSKLISGDLMAYKRKSKGQVYIVYAIDASGSMKGEKIKQCKKAGIALSYKAIEEKDKVGLIVFGKEVKEKIEPTQDFPLLIKTVANIRASNETDIASTNSDAIELFPNKNVTKHLILLSDALPTKGKKPEQSTLEAVSKARASNITISFIGIKLDEKGEKLAKKIAEFGGGRLYKVTDIEDIDKLVLEDYFSVI